MTDQQFYLVTFSAPLPRIMKDGVSHEIASAIGEIPDYIEQSKHLGDHFVPVRATLLVLKVARPGSARRPMSFDNGEVAYSYDGFVSVHRDRIAAVTYANRPLTGHLPRL